MNKKATIIISYCLIAISFVACATTSKTFIEIKKPDQVREFGELKYKVSPGDILEVLDTKMCRYRNETCWKVSNIKTGEGGYVVAERMKKRHHVYEDRSRYHKAIELNPKNAKAYFNRGLAYYKKSLYDHAIYDYTKVIEINSRDDVAYYNRGLAYYDKGQYGKAISDYTDAIELSPKYLHAYNNRGYTYLTISQYGQAISDFNKAIEIDPKIAKVYDNRGFAYWKKCQLDKACSDWKRACELGLCKNYELMKRKGDCK